MQLLRDHLLKFEDQLSTDKPKVEVTNIIDKYRYNKFYSFFFLAALRLFSKIEIRFLLAILPRSQLIIVDPSAVTNIQTRLRIQGMIEKKQRDLKALESKFTNEINKTKQLRKETDTKINKYEDEKTYAIKVELAKNKKSREEQEEKYAAEIGNEVQML